MSCIVYVMSMHCIPLLVHYAPLSAERDQTEGGMLLPLNIQYQSTEKDFNEAFREYKTADRLHNSYAI